MNTKSILKEDMTPLERVVADYLEKVCTIPGCMPILHREDAQNILKLLLEFSKQQKAGN